MDGVPRLGGVYLPLVTPFSDSGDVDLDSLERIAHHFLDAGLAGLVALGTTGEPATLTVSERQRWSRCARRCAWRALHS